MPASTAASGYLPSLTNSKTPLVASLPPLVAICETALGSTIVPGSKPPASAICPIFAISLLSCPCSAICFPIACCLLSFKILPIPVSFPNGELIKGSLKGLR